MTSKYEHFTDDGLISAVRQMEDAKNTARYRLVQWQERMEKQLIVDILETIASMKEDESLSDEKFIWTTPKALEFLVREFAVGQRYAMGKIG